MVKQTANHQVEVKQTQDASYDLTEIEKSVIERIRGQHNSAILQKKSQITPLNEVVETLLSRLRLVRAIKLAELGESERAAAGVLLQSGEANIYRDEKNHQYIQKSSLITMLKKPVSL